MVFPVCLFSLSIMCLRFMHICIAWIIISFYSFFFFLLAEISLYGYTIFIYLFIIDEYLGFSHILAIINNPAMNIYLRVLCKHILSILLSTYIRVECCHMPTSYFIFWRTAKLSSKEAASFYIPIRSEKNVPVFHIFSNVFYCLSFWL